MMMRVLALSAPFRSRLIHVVDNPFEKHFTKPDESRLSECIQDIKAQRWSIGDGLSESPWHRRVKQPSTNTLYPVVLDGTGRTKGLQGMNVRISFLMVLLTAADFINS